MKRSRPWTLGLVLGWLGCLIVLPLGGALDTLAEQTPLEGEPIQEVRVEGNQRIDAAAILENLETKPKGQLRSSSIDQDIRSIYAMGYFDDVRVYTEATPQGVRVMFQVKERPMILSIRFEGNKKLKEDRLKEALLLKEHTILDPAKVQEGITAIRKRYREEGYFFATVSSRIEPKEGNTADVVYKINENKAVKVVKITFQGNEHFKEKELKSALAIKEKGFFSWITSSGKFTEEMLETEPMRLSSFYMDRGFINVQVSRPEVKLTEEGVTLHFSVREGDRYSVGSLDIEGDLIEPKEKLMPLLTLKTGSVFSASELRANIAKLSDAYADKGYAYVNVDPGTQVDDQNKLVHVRFTIDKGNLVQIRRIDITGNSKTLDKVIRRELKVEEGDTYSRSLIERSRERVNFLGFFDDVKVATKRVDETRSDIDVQVKEGQTGTISAGAGYSSYDKMVFQGQVTERNFRGRGETLSFATAIGSRREEFDIGFTEPYFLDTNLSLGVNLFINEREFDEYGRRDMGGSVRVGMPVGEYTRIGLGYTYQDVKISDIPYFFGRYLADSGIRDWGDQYRTKVDQPDKSSTSSVTFTVSRNTTDHPIDPTRGNVQGVAVEYAGDFMGGTNDFVRYMGQSAWFWPTFIKNVVFSLRGQMGFIQSNSDDPLPYYERFWAGGIETLRGFDYRAVSPRDRAGHNVHIGGDKLLVFNAEVIFPLIKRMGIKGVVFGDAGNVYSYGNSFDPGNMRKDVGFGIRWRSPLGPLRVEIGFPIDKRYSNDDSFKVNFSMGAPYRGFGF